MRYLWIGLGAAVLCTAALWQARGEPSRPEAADDALVKRGEYLVNEVAHCTHCHTPVGDKGRPDRERSLQGAILPIMPKDKNMTWAAQSPDITRSGLAGQWREEDFVKFLMTGQDPEGKTPRPPMPVFHLQKDDARAVTLYLRSLPGKKGRTPE